jgi:hypothetical protein
MEKGTAWFMWPFVALARLVAGIVSLTGRFVAIMLGVVLMILGLIFTITFLGAIIGIPVFLFGLLLVYRGLF